MNVTTECDELKKQRSQIHANHKDYQLLLSRYHVTLELLGEKEEMVKELREDILDLKEVLRRHMVDSLSS